MFKLHRYALPQNYGLNARGVSLARQPNQGPPKVTQLPPNNDNMDLTITSETTNDISVPDHGDAGQQGNQQGSQHTGRTSSISVYLDGASQQGSANEDDRDASQYNHGASQRDSASGYDILARQQSSQRSDEVNYVIRHQISASQPDSADQGALDISRQNGGLTDQPSSIDQISHSTASKSALSSGQSGRDTEHRANTTNGSITAFHNGLTSGSTNESINRSVNESINGSTNGSPKREEQRRNYSNTAAHNETDQTNQTEQPQPQQRQPDGESRVEDTNDMEMDYGYSQDHLDQTGQQEATQFEAQLVRKLAQAIRLRNPSRNQIDCMRKRFSEDIYTQLALDEVTGELGNNGDRSYHGRNNDNRSGDEYGNNNDNHSENDNRSEDEYSGSYDSWENYSLGDPDMQEVEEKYGQLFEDLRMEGFDPPEIFEALKWLMEDNSLDWQDLRWAYSDQYGDILKGTRSVARRTREEGDPGRFRHEWGEGPDIETVDFEDEGTLVAPASSAASASSEPLAGFTYGEEESKGSDSDSGNLSLSHSHSHSHSYNDSDSDYSDDCDPESPDDLPTYANCHRHSHSNGDVNDDSSSNGGNAIQEQAALKTEGTLAAEERAEVRVTIEELGTYLRDEAVKAIMKSNVNTAALAYAKEVYETGYGAPVEQYEGTLTAEELAEGEELGIRLRNIALAGIEGWSWDAEALTHMREIYESGIDYACHARCTSGCNHNYETESGGGSKDPQSPDNTPTQGNVNKKARRKRKKKKARGKTA